MGDEVPDSPNTMRSVERALDVLSVLQRKRVPLRLSEVSREAELHLATTQRILNVLTRFDYVQQNAQGYSVGITSLVNAHAFLVSNSLSLVATPVLQELAQSTGFTASLSVRVGWSQVLLVRIEGSTPLRYQLPVGEQLPLHLGGARVLVAAMEPDEIDQLIEHVGVIRLVTGEEIDADHFRETLALIKERGYAYGESQRELGAASISVPVFGREGTVMAAMQLSGLAEDFAGSVIDSYGAELTRASASITRRIP